MSENSELFKKPKPGTQFQCKQTSSINQPSWSMRRSEAEPTIKSWYSSFRGWERSLDRGRLRRDSWHLQTNCASLFSLCWPSGFGFDLRWGNYLSPFTSTLCPSTKIGPSKPIFQRTSGSPDQAYLDLHYVDVDNRPVYGPSVFGLHKVIWKGILKVPADHS